jgi:hypothetical protein
MLKQGDEYFAGLFDGEGSVGIYAVSNGKKRRESGQKNYWSPKLAIVGTYRPQIEAAYLHFGVGSISTQKRQALQKLPKGLTIDPKLCKQGWRWMAQRKSDILLVLERIFPYLIEKKEQAEIVMKFCKGELAGEEASKLCKGAKQFEFVSSSGESPRKSTGSPSEWNPAAKLTYEQAQDIRRRVAAGERQVGIAREFGVTRTQVNRIVNNITYTRPPLSYNKDEVPPILEAPVKRFLGPAKLTYEQAQEVRGLLAGGMKQADIARKFNVNKGLISKIVNNLTYTRPPMSYHK